MWELREACPACEGRSNDLLLEIPYADSSLRRFLTEYYADKIPATAYETASYRLLKCRECALIYQAQAPDDELSQIVYEPPASAPKSVEEVFEGYERNRSLGHFLSLVPDLAAAIDFLGGRPRNLKVLDFGMGWGNWVRLAQGFGCAVVGLESSPVRMAWAEKCHLPLVHWDDLPNHQFDFIHTEQVIEHVAAPREVVSRLAACLRPGGLLKLSVPNGQTMSKLIANRVWEEDWRRMRLAQPLEHLNVFQSRSLEALVDGAGLERVHLATRFEYRLKERAKNLVRPLYWRLRGRTSTSHFYRRLD